MVTGECAEDPRFYVSSDGAFWEPGVPGLLPPGSPSLAGCPELRSWVHSEPALPPGLQETLFPSGQPGPVVLLLAGAVGARAGRHNACHSGTPAPGSPLPCSTYSAGPLVL